tara:strand:- start:1182 stop:1406 length:225 start_codon:yes stop_codon:yes gene_type:complete
LGVLLICRGLRNQIKTERCPQASIFKEFYKYNRRFFANTFSKKVESFTPIFLKKESPQNEFYNKKSIVLLHFLE